MVCYYNQTVMNINYSWLFVYYNTTALFDSYILCCCILIVNRCPPYIKTEHYPNLQRTEIDLEIVFDIKKICLKFFRV
jgi:hypothetical protein